MVVLGKSVVVLDSVVVVGEVVVEGAVVVVVLVEVVARVVVTVVADVAVVVSGVVSSGGVTLALLDDDVEDGLLVLVATGVATVGVVSLVRGRLEVSVSMTVLVAVSVDFEGSFASVAEIGGSRDKLLVVASVASVAIVPKRSGLPVVIGSGGTVERSVVVEEAAVEYLNWSKNLPHPVTTHCSPGGGSFPASGRHTGEIRSVYFIGYGSRIRVRSFAGAL